MSYLCVILVPRVPYTVLQSDIHNSAQSTISRSILLIVSTVDEYAENFNVLIIFSSLITLKYFQY